MKSRIEGPSLNDIPEPKWVVEMRQHFVEKGTYRQSDVDHVLGKPWDTVKVDASGHLQLACRASHSQALPAHDASVGKKK